MKLSIFERLTLLGVIPPQTGDIAKIRIVRQLRENLGLSEDEHKFYELKTVGNTFQWNMQKDNEVQGDIEMGDVALEIIKTSFKQANDNGTLQETWLDVYDKFVGTTEQDKPAEQSK